MRLIYQCLQCGARRTSDQVVSERTPKELLFGQNPDVMLALNMPHDCADGTVGVAMLIGATAQ